MTDFGNRVESRIERRYLERSFAVVYIPPELRILVSVVTDGLGSRSTYGLSGPSSGLQSVGPEGMMPMESLGLMVPVLSIPRGLRMDELIISEKFVLVTFSRARPSRVYAIFE